MSTDPSTPDVAAEQAAPDPTFAPPTPPGVLPAEGLADAPLPGGPAGPFPATPAGPVRPPGSPGERARARRRATRAAAGVVALAVVAGGVALGVMTARDRAWAPLPADVASPREANAVQLVLGSCLGELPAGDLARVTVVPCGADHAAQVVGRTDAAPDVVWPGAEALVRRTSAVCGPEQLGPAGRDTEGVEFVVLTPSEAAWEAGDRAGLCLAVPEGGGAVDLLT